MNHHGTLAQGTFFLSLGCLLLLLCQGIPCLEVAGDAPPPGIMELSCSKTEFSPVDNFTIHVTLPGEGNVSIEIDGPGEELVYLKTLAINEEGSFDLELVPGRNWPLGNYTVSAVAGTPEGPIFANTGFELRSPEDFRPDFYLGPGDLFLAPRDFGDWLAVASFQEELQVMASQAGDLQVFVLVHNRGEVNGSARLRVILDEAGGESLLGLENISLEANETLEFSFPLPFTPLQGERREFRLHALVEDTSPLDRNPFDNELEKDFTLVVIPDSEEGGLVITIPVSPAPAAVAVLVLFFLGVSCLSEQGRFYYYLFFAYLTTRITKATIEEDIEKQNIRGRIYQHIFENPGTHFTQIRRAVKVANGSLSHHLLHLQKKGFVKSKGLGLEKVFWSSKYSFPDNKSYPSQEFPILNGKRRPIVLALLKGEFFSVRDLVLLTNLPRATITNHLRKMKVMGMVQKTRKGYRLVDSYREHVLSYEMKLQESGPAQEESTITLEL